MFAQPQEQHQWLHRIVGDWEMESECSMGPDQPPSKQTGRDRVRSLGGMWILCEGEGEMPGGGIATSVMTIGFDPVRNRFVGSFVASCMSNLWIYDGAFDASGKILNLDSVGPSFTEEGKLVNYRDAIEILDDDHRTLTSYCQDPEGNWVSFMKARYRRVKPA